MTTPQERGERGLTEDERESLNRAQFLTPPTLEDNPVHRAVESILAAREQAARAEAWDEGYEAAEQDERRAKSSPFHTSGCDCLVPTENPHPYRVEHKEGKG